MDQLEPINVTCPKCGVAWSYVLPFGGYRSRKKTLTCAGCREAQEQKAAEAFRGWN